jgi:hypothetical protein
MPLAGRIELDTEQDRQVIQPDGIKRPGAASVAFIS